MNGFEMLLCCLLVPVAYVLIYIAGRYNVLALVGKALQEWARSLQHGTWNKFGNDLWRCSNCMAEISTPEKTLRLLHYCYNCGKKMDLQNEDEKASDSSAAT